MKYLILTIILTFSLNSCIIEEKADDFSSKNTNSEKQQDEPILVYTKYDLPLPVDFYRFLKEQNSPDTHTTNLNPVENIEKYISNKDRGINFGIYASDLAYCTVFDKKQLCIDYFNITKELADILHIAKGYSMTVVERLNNNLNNNDSLHAIASKSYWNACNYLEANDEVNILPLIISGGWIESIYLAVISIDENNPPEHFLKRLTSEKQSLENLSQYLLDVIADSNTFEINSDIQELGTNLNAIRKIYKNVPEGNVLTKRQLKNLKKEVIKVRNNYANEK